MPKEETPKKKKDNSEEELKQESQEDEKETEEEDSLEEVISEVNGEIDFDNFQDFFQPKKIDFSPSLEQINSSQENMWTRKESAKFEEEKEKINYLTSEESGLKYEHYEVDPLKETKSFDPLNSIIKTPEKILEEQTRIHKQTFMQDPMLKSSKEQREKERGYFSTPDVNSKKEFDNISKDYAKMNRR